MRSILLRHHVPGRLTIHSFDVDSVKSFSWVKKMVVITTTAEMVRKIKKDAVDRKWTLLETKAKKEPLKEDDGKMSHGPDLLPSWLVPDKLRKCQAICLKHFAR